MRILASAGLILLMATLTAAPASAQAAGSADAKAAKRANPTWKAPRTPWGHPDLEGTWTTDDMKGVPLSRAVSHASRTPDR
jgi:hypothetical protein